MPIYNRAWSLPAVLDAIRKLDYPKDKIRIIFVDNKSTDETLLILRDFKKQMESAYERVVIVLERCNIPEARNICVTKSVGEYILFIDSDIIAPPNAVRRLLKLFTLDPKARITSFPRRSDPMALEDKIDFSTQLKQPQYEVTSEIGMDCTMIKRELFNDVGLFDRKYRAREDRELVLRANESGYISILDSSKPVRHLQLYKRGIIKEIIWNCVDSFKAHNRFMILRKYKPKWMVKRLLFYSMFTLSIPLAIISIIMKNPVFALPLIMSYGFIFIYYFRKCSGIWRFINPTLRSLFGIFFVLGVFWEIVKISLTYRRNTYRGCEEDEKKQFANNNLFCEPCRALWLNQVQF